MATTGIVEQADTGAKERKLKKPDTKHDPLHDRMVDGALRHCWCFCPQCWKSYSPGKGRCICPQCPCEKNVSLLSRVRQV